MKEYNYDNMTGEYLGAEEAFESPCEPGKYIISANATTTKPNMAPLQGEALIWKSEQWQVVEDNREKEIIIFKSESEYDMQTSRAIELPENSFVYTEELKKVISSGEHLKLIDSKIVIEGKTEKELAEDQIRELKQQLTGSDYKITKNAEALSVGLECPYPAKKLHAQREKIRGEINKLELKLKKL